jgi:hypothetical protein
MNERDFQSRYYTASYRAQLEAEERAATRARRRKLADEGPTVAFWLVVSWLAAYIALDGGPPLARELAACWLAASIGGPLIALAILALERLGGLFLGWRR